MGLFGEIGDALHNPLDYAGNALGRFNHLATKESWDYQTQNMYQNTVKDLRAAGLNPIMAYQNGPNTASVSQASVGQLGDAINSALSLSQIQKNKADAELASNTARDMGAKADLEEAVNQQILKNPGDVRLMASGKVAPKSTAHAVTAGIKELSNELGPEVGKAVSGIANSAKDTYERWSQGFEGVKKFVDNGIKSVKSWFNGSGSTTKGGTN